MTFFFLLLVSTHSSNKKQKRRLYFKCHAFKVQWNVDNFDIKLDGTVFIMQ